MKNYIKPTANVINVAVRESLSARDIRQRTYTFNNRTKQINTAIYTSKGVSKIQVG